MAKKKLIKSKKLVSGGDRGVRSRNVRKELAKEHLQRKEQAQTIDNELIAPIAPDVQHWREDPNRWDVPGVDTPIDWRNKSEKDLLEAIETGKLKPSRLTPKDQIRIVEIKLKWQKRYPFIFAFAIDAQGEIFDGLEQYYWALQNDIDVGFSLLKPELDFIDTYNLKRYDIKGMKFIVIPADSKVLKGANGYYDVDIETIVLPPTDGFTKNQRERTMQHEVGHHIYHNSKQLELRWKAYDKVKLKAFTGTHYKNPRMTGIEEVSMSEAMQNPKKYFMGDLPIREISTWRKHYQKKSIRGEILDLMCSDEAFAETFRTYRNGTLKKRLKDEREYYDFLSRDLKESKQELSELERMPMKNRTKEQKELIRDYRTFVRKSMKMQEYSRGLQDNYMTVLAWMKKYDKQGWMRGKVGGETKVTSKSFKPFEIREGDLMMYEGDIEVLKIRKGDKE